MITPNNQINVPAVTADALWISNLNISAPSLEGKVMANIRLIPYNSTSSVMYNSLSKNIIINDLFATASINPTLATALEAVYVAVQTLVSGSNLY